MVTLRALLNPKDTAVEAMSFSIDLGITPYGALCGGAYENFQPLATHDGNQGVNSFPFSLFNTYRKGLLPLRFVSCLDMKRIHPGRLTKDTSGGGIKVLDKPWAEGNQSAIGIGIRVQQTFKAIPDAYYLPSQFASRNGRAHDHGIRSRDKACPHVNGNASVRACMT